MCIIAIKPRGQKMWSKKQLETMWENNPDGSGFMYLKRGRVYIDKGYMSFNCLYNALTSQDFTNYDLVLHFRISTSGLIDSNNCHPFPIYEENKLNRSVKVGMAHNGILRGYEPIKGSAYNDTQKFIKDVLKDLNPSFVYSKNCLDLIKEIIGTNKLAFLSHKGISLVGNFINDNGYIYSNDSYKPRKVYTSYPSYSSYYNDYEDFDSYGSYDFFAKQCKLDMK